MNDFRLCLQQRRAHEVCSTALLSSETTLAATQCAHALISELSNTAWATLSDAAVADAMNLLEGVSRVCEALEAGEQLLAIKQITARANIARHLRRAKYDAGRVAATLDALREEQRACGGTGELLVDAWEGVDHAAFPPADPAEALCGGSAGLCVALYLVHALHVNNGRGGGGDGNGESENPFAAAVLGADSTAARARDADAKAQAFAVAVGIGDKLAAAVRALWVLDSHVAGGGVAAARDACRVLCEAHAVRACVPVPVHT